MENKRRVTTSILVTVALLLLFTANLPFDYSLWDCMVLVLLLIALGNLLYELWRLKRVKSSTGV